MGSFRMPGAYDMDDDKPLSEDEYGFEMLNLDDDENEGRERVPGLSVHANNTHHNTTPRPENGNEIEEPWFYPTPTDIALVRSMFPLPPELVTEILDLAKYWVYSRSISSKSHSFENANVRYLRSGRIQGGEFLHPLRRVVITTESKDQGWSSYPEDRGTRNNSWTWFELTLDDGKTGDEIVRVEVVRNIHAGPTFEKHQAIIEDERILGQAKKGDTLSVWARAKYPGWCNYVRSVGIEAWVAC